MKIRHVSIRNFRGIRELEWNIQSDTVCLIGPGDSTKTTVLDAISHTLAPSRFLGFNDADFHRGNIEEEISIEVTVAEPPRPLLTESKYGLLQRGWSPEGGLTDDPVPDGTVALTIRLRVDDTLEPRWTVTKGASDEGKPIGWKDRAALQLFRVGENPNNHLRWGRGSALAALMADEDEVDSTLVDAYRQAREAAFAAPHEMLNAAAASAYEHAVAFGISAGPEFRPGLDPAAIGGATRLTLHQDEIPLVNSGLGTRRLVALALQRAGVAGSSILLVDEVEHGLEPFRLLHLLQSLREATEGSNGVPGVAQVLLTTHAADVVAELRADELHVVRAADGVTVIQRLTDAFADPIEIDPQAIARAGAAALLARRVIVAEGRTEVGYFRAMARMWRNKRRVPVAHLGTTIMDGGGQQAPGRAIGFSALGYETALFVDSDTTLNPPETAVAAAGARVIRWDDGVSIEERVARDIPQQELRRLVELAIQLTEDEHAVFDAIQAQLPPPISVIGTTDVQSWITEAVSIETVRNAIGRAAKKKKWFKGIEQGERLGELVGGLLAQMAGTDTEKKTLRLERFSYGEPEEPLS